MIPPDVANSLRQMLPDLHSASNAQTQPVLPTQRIADVLGNLVPGQRLLAEIQALLPNGTYRAVVAQRDITLALPFSAKPGDSLELEVVETDGKVALAYVAGKAPSAQTALPQESVPTNLSQTGKLIGNLLGNIDSQGNRAPPTPLNGNQPLVNTMPATASELAPVLKQALTQSGMFYEAHQARWVAGELPTRQLLQEPQGQLSQLRILSGQSTPSATQPPGTMANGHLTTLPTGNTFSNTPPASLFGEMPLTTVELLTAKSQQTLPSQPAVSTPQQHQPDNSLPRTSAPPPAEILSAQAARADMAYAQQAVQVDTPGLGTSQVEMTASRQTHSTQVAQIAPEVAPIVQQQLDALATQTFAWQGQIWPGQEMFWEINEDSGNSQQGRENDNTQWQTRLKLNLPQLGGIEASLCLRQGREIEISLNVEQGASGVKLDAAGEMLKQQFADAGLNLFNLVIKHAPPAE